MPRALAVAVVLTPLATAGCGGGGDPELTTDRVMNEVKIGMTVEQVKAAFGEPNDVTGGLVSDSVQAFVYRVSPRTVYVDFNAQGRVTAIGAPDTDI